MPFRGNDHGNVDTSTLVSKAEAHTAFVNQAGDTMEGDLNLNSNRVKNAVLEDCTIASNPVLNSQPVTKEYLDQRLSGLDAIYVNEAGDVIEGEVSMSGHKITNLRYPTNDTDAVNKKYADRHREWFNLSSNFLRVVKPIDMNSNKITELADPTASKDAANKKYVDEKVLATGSRNHLTYNATSLGLKLPIDMNNKKITELAAPTELTDAATKNYVDSRYLRLVADTPRVIPFFYQQTVPETYGNKVRISLTFELGIYNLNNNNPHYNRTGVVSYATCKNTSSFNFVELGDERVLHFHLTFYHEIPSDDRRIFNFGFVWAFPTPTPNTLNDVVLEQGWTNSQNQQENTEANEDTEANTNADTNTETNTKTTANTYVLSPEVFRALI